MTNPHLTAIDAVAVGAAPDTLPALRLRLSVFLKVVEIILDEFRRAMLATQRYETMQASAHMCASDIPRRLFDELYNEPTQPWEESP